MLKKLTALLLFILTLFIFTACGTESSDGKEVKNTDGSKIRVIVTFNAIREFTAAVGGEKIEISTIIPNGTEPHDFEPKAQDLVGLSKARIFVYNGLGMETWADNAVTASGNKNLITVDASKGIDPIKNTDENEIKEHGSYDPHTWLSLKCAEIEVKNIKEGLVKADPSNKEYYEKNCADYILKLEALFDEYSKKFASVQNKSFVTGHSAFSYLCRDFGLNQESIEDVFAEGEPSAQKLAFLIDYCRKNKVTTIFSESMASPEVSKTLSKEVGAKVESIYTIESEEDNKTYLERMSENLEMIYKGSITE